MYHSICAICNRMITNRWSRSVRADRQVTVRLQAEDIVSGGGLAAGPRRPYQRASLTGSPAAALYDVDGTVPGGVRGTSRGTARRVIPAQPVPSVE